jgi:hypothetical protein
MTLGFDGCGDVTTGLSLRRDIAWSRRHGYVLGALVGMAIGVFPAMARAATPEAASQRALPSEPPRDGVEEGPQKPEAPAKVDALLRAFYAPMSVGMMGVGLEAQYRPSPHYGFGGELDAFFVDNGADPYYSPNGTLSRGYHGLAFVEGDLLPGMLTPYVRLGLGLGRYTRFRDYRDEQQLDFTAQVSAGGLLRVGPVVARLSAAPSLYGKDFAMTYAFALGARL